MTKNQLIDEYLDWMYQKVYNDRYSKKTSYRRLLRYLYSVNFTYTIDMDGNRAEDGVDLRYRFADEKRYIYPMITEYLDDRPCSVLEMMVALAIRIEEHIMEDASIGDRTGKWFWTMVESLGLDSVSDSRFDRGYIDQVIDRFLNRRFNRNGKGGLFTVEHTRRDMRTMEIWYQMCLYIDSIL